MQSFEVEMKALLGSFEKADSIRQALIKLDPSCKLESHHKQLDNDFTGGTLKKLVEVLAPHLSGICEIKMDDLVARASDFSVQSRDRDGIVHLILRANIEPSKAVNNIMRIDLEEKMQITLDELDKLILSAGFSYKVKWSRQREEYFCHGTAVMMDKNAGYGWTVQLERFVDDDAKVDATKQEVKKLLTELGLSELSEERLIRLKEAYQRDWQKYYGSDSVFTLE